MTPQAPTQTRTHTLAATSTVVSHWLGHADRSDGNTCYAAARRHPGTVGKGWVGRGGEKTLTPEGEHPIVSKMLTLMAFSGKYTAVFHDVSEGIFRKTVSYLERTERERESHTHTHTHLNM